MIKSEKGVVQVTGDEFDIIFELHNLIKQLCEKSPSIIAAVMYKNHNRMEEAIMTSNLEECDRVESAIDFIERVRKEHNND